MDLFQFQVNILGWTGFATPFATFCHYEQKRSGTGCKPVPALKQVANLFLH
jgi:hypothetical protein